MQVIDVIADGRRQAGLRRDHVRERSLVEVVARLVPRSEPVDDGEVLVKVAGECDVLGKRPEVVAA